MAKSVDVKFIPMKMVRHIAALLILVVSVHLTDHCSTALPNAFQSVYLNDHEKSSVEGASANEQSLQDLITELIASVFGHFPQHVISKRSNSDTTKPDNSKFLDGWFEAISGFFRPEIPHDPVDDDPPAASQTTDKSISSSTN